MAAKRSPGPIRSARPRSEVLRANRQNAWSTLLAKALTTRVYTAGCPEPEEFDRTPGFWNRPPGMANKLAAVILAAGQGTRMRSSRSKVLHELCDESLVNFPVALAKSLGADPVVLVLGHQAEDVEAAVRARFDDVQVRLQTERKGTAHAVMQGMKALKSFEGKVLILSGDVPLLGKDTARRLVKKLDGGKTPLALLSAHLEDPTGYGRIVRNDEGHCERIVEHKDANEAERGIHEINAGIYCADASFLRKALKNIGNNNAQGEYYLTDIVPAAAKGDRPVHAIPVADYFEVEGINDRRQLAKMGQILRSMLIHKHQQNGVTFEDPNSAYVGMNVKIGQDTRIEPGVHLRGQTRIGSHVHIDVGAVITNSKVADGVTIKPYSILEDAQVDAKGQIGPFARLRPGARVMQEARVGNFVEIKNTKLGKGAKANHLAYLGDSDIGEGANVGAGTITCNYDGYGKHKTKIAAGVFVGSNSTLVAPVEIAKDAYVAAGSVVTEAVKKDDLAFGRARQVNKKGLAKPLREQAKQRAAESKKKKRG